LHKSQLVTTQELIKSWISNWKNQEKRVHDFLPFGRCPCFMPTAQNKKGLNGRRPKRLQSKTAHWMDLLPCSR
jgi:hypothetical protein